MTPDETDRELRELRTLYYGMKEELAVVKVGMQNVEKGLEKTNKILSWVGGVMGGSFLVAIANLVLRAGGV